MHVKYAAIPFKYAGLTNSQKVLMASVYSLKGNFRAVHLE